MTLNSLIYIFLSVFSSANLVGCILQVMYIRNVDHRQTEEPDFESLTTDFQGTKSSEAERDYTQMCNLLVKEAAFF